MTPEQAEVLGTFTDMLRSVTADGGRKRAAGAKPSWKVDGSHRAAIFSHLNKWEHGEKKDKDSGAHPLVHLAWRALAIAWQETKAEDMARDARHVCGLQGFDGMRDTCDACARLASTRDGIMESLVDGCAKCHATDDRNLVNGVCGPCHGLGTSPGLERSKLWEEGGLCDAPNGCRRTALPHETRCAYHRTRRPNLS